MLNHHLRLNDKQLMDIFILLENDQRYAALNYILDATHYNHEDATSIIVELTQQRSQALERYKEQDWSSIPTLEESKTLILEEEFGFNDEFIDNLNLSHWHEGSPQDQRSFFSPKHSVQYYCLALIALCICLTLSIWFSI